MTDIDLQTFEEIGPALGASLRTALSRLDPRSREVIYRRYGLVSQRQSLGEVSEVYGVTAERIRQIQTKALRQMRQGVQRHWSAAGQGHLEEFWQALVGEDGVVLERDICSSRRQLSPWIVLALELCEMQLEDVLDSYTQRFGAGWVPPNWRVEELAAIRTNLEQLLAQTALPCSLAALSPAATAPMSRAVLVLIGYHCFGTYVTRKRPSLRIRRALRLHVTLGNAGKALHAVDLASKYRDQLPGDACAARDCEIVMRAQDHLFLEVMEGYWAALGPPGETPMALGLTKTAGETGGDSEFETASADEPWTICDSLILELRNSGPSRISHLVKRAPSFLPAGRSEDSIGRALISLKDVFIRPLPGIYALHDQVPSPAHLLSAPPPYMFHEYQARLYALARRAGEPWGTYPLWLPASEYLWCEWAQMRGDTRLLENLLSVAQVDAWPMIGRLETWREAVRTRGRFSLQFPPDPSALVRPSLDRVLAACLYVRQHGCLGWISGNRLLMQNVQAHRSAGLLALLVALKIVDPDGEDWQSPHRPGSRLDEQMSRLEGARAQSGNLNWDTVLGRELKCEAIAAPSANGWVSPELVHELLGCKSSRATP